MPGLQFYKNNIYLIRNEANFPCIEIQVTVSVVPIPISHKTQSTTLSCRGKRSDETSPKHHPVMSRPNTPGKSPDGHRGT
jgi:hypothetical protein